MAEGAVDDGRAVADMNVEGFRWFIPARNKRHRKELAELNITKAERRAMIRGALLAVLPVAFAFIGMFASILLIIHFWLS